MPANDDASLAALLVDEAPDALLALSPEGRVLFWNRGAEALFGYAARETVGRTLDELTISEKDREQARRALEQVNRSGRTSFEASRRCKDGSMVHVEVAMRKVVRSGA